jgi:hypothetical protein
LARYEIVERKIWGDYRRVWRNDLLRLRLLTLSAQAELAGKMSYLACELEYSLDLAGGNDVATHFPIHVRNGKNDAVTAPVCVGQYLLYELRPIGG